MYEAILEAGKDCGLKPVGLLAASGMLRLEKGYLSGKEYSESINPYEAGVGWSVKLDTDFIDIGMIHYSDALSDWEEIVHGPVMAYAQELKEAGRIGHLGLTAHSLEVFQRALELDWVETVMFPYNIVETQGEALIKKAQAKNIGFIAMKPLAGGAIEDAALALRFIAANDAVTVLIPGMYDPKEVAQNKAAVEDAAPLTQEELSRMERVRQALGTNFCRRCSYCAPCTMGISIPNAFLFHGYLSRYGLEDWARGRYETMPVKAGACVDCGACEERCPYQLPIREMLKKVAVSICGAVKLEFFAV